MTAIASSSQAAGPFHVVVIGAGIIGLTTARALVEAGHRVTLIDRADGPARGTSGQNGAQLSYGYVAPLASPALLPQIPGLLLSRDSPLRLRPGWSPAIWRWCLQFLSACTASRAERTTRELLALADESRAQFTRWRAGIDARRIDHAGNGKLVVYRDAGALRSARAQLELQAPHGPAQQLCSAARCLEIEPALAADGAPVVGGVWTPSEEVADCAKVCELLAEQLAAQPRCRLRWNTDALGWAGDANAPRSLRVRSADGPAQIEADAFVVAAGAATPALLRPLGAHLPIAPLKGYSIELPAARIARMPQVSVTDAASKIVFAPLGDGPNRRLRVAGFAELVGPDLSIPPARIERLLQAVDRLFGLKEAPASAALKPWAGLRPATPTGLPIVGQLAGRVFVNAGQGALGFTLAFGSAARLVAELQRSAAAMPSTSSSIAALDGWSRERSA